MVDFCKESEKDCKENPIDGLDLKIEQYYSSIYSKLFSHTSDTVVHITQEERDEWNNKASKDALKDMQDQLNEITGDGDSSIKNQVSSELKEYVNTIIAGLDINSYAKREYVSKLVSDIDLSDYAEKDWCNETFVKIGRGQSGDLSNYYTKSDVNKLINDYSIKALAFKDNELELVQNGVGGKAKTFVTKIDNESDGVSLEYLESKLDNYLKKSGVHDIILNGHALNLVSEDIVINTPGYTPVDGKDGSTYTPYFQNNNSWKIAPALPANYKSPAESTGEGSKWSTQVITAKDGEYTWVTYVPIDTNGAFGKWSTPICLTGHSEDQQKLAGSPLRNRGEWTSGTQYYDGYTAQIGDAFWQDYVSHTVNGIANYYICTKYNLDKEPGATGSENYWSLLSYTDDMFVNNLVARKADIGELSANEIIIKDDSNTVRAGMTSGKSTNVSGQGDVRIWAGSNGNGNIAAAPFTVTESGVLKSTNANISGEIHATSGYIGNDDNHMKIYNDADGNVALISQTETSVANNYISFDKNGMLELSSSYSGDKGTTVSPGEVRIQNTEGRNTLFRSGFINISSGNNVAQLSYTGADGKLIFCLDALPTSSDGLPTGWVWNDGGTLKIVS